MGTLDYKKAAKEMKKQQKEGKKDRYMEITNTLLAVEADSLTVADTLEYIEILADTLDVMDFQIYELYRAIQDRMVLLLRTLAGEEAFGERHCRERLTVLAKRAIEKGFMTGESVESLLEEKGEQVGLSEIPERIDLKLLFASARSMTLEICKAGYYETDTEYEVYVNGYQRQTARTCIFSLYDLKPGKTYEITVVSADRCACGRLMAATGEESCTLDVRQFGAGGDGKQDDTKFIQAAILACPKEGRVLIPAGTYRITSLFLKSDLSLEIAENAELLADTDRSSYPKFPGVIPSTRGEEDYYLGTWEGNPLPMFAGILCGVEAENVRIYGKGILNGNASKKDWWENPKQMRGAYRPRLFFLSRCRHIYLQGITLKNSPSWTIHPFFSDDLGFYDLTISNPFDSPNTDGLDPESCRHVEVAGVKFSLGDDCIAVKSGKIYMGKKFKRPSEDIYIHHCLMENGHGAVTIGSEMAGGVKNLSVEDCVFSHTDRGLRIKTRRGRGEDAVLDRIAFRRISMDHVMTPFVVNSFYFCDPDGKTEYVQSRKAYPVDEGTPCIKTLIFEEIDAKNCHVAAAYLEGLPEQKIEEITMRNISVDYAEHPKCDVPAMSDGVEACSKKGIYARNIKRLVLQNVEISGQAGPATQFDDVDEIIKEEKAED